MLSNFGEMGKALDTSRTLWMEGIDEVWMDEEFIKSLFAGVSSNISIKILRDNSSISGSGYAFIDFPSQELAERVLHAYNGLPIPNTSKTFQLKWAQYGQVSQEQQPQEIASANSLLVSELDQSVQNAQLFEFFSAVIPGVTSAKVASDPLTGRSKGFGYLTFATAKDCQRALVEMQGAMLLGKSVTLSPSKQGDSDLYSEHFVDSTGCTLFVQELTSLYSSEDALKGYFTQFGEVSHVKVIRTEACAFVKFTSKVSTDKAVAFLNDVLARNEKPLLNWVKVGPTFNLKQQLRQASTAGGGGEIVEVAQQSKDVFMRKLDVVELNLEYIALHCDQYLELTDPKFLIS